MVKDDNFAGGRVLLVIVYYSLYKYN